MHKYESQRVVFLLVIARTVPRATERGVDLMDQAQIENHQASRCSEGIALRRVRIIQQHECPGNAV